MKRQCVILVGGMGTRLGQLTRQTPKPLLPIDGRPFLDILIQEVARFGFTDIILLAGYLGGQFVERFAGPRHLAGRNVTVRVIVEPEPAGTGGALCYLCDVAEPHFLLINGDSWCDVDLRAFAEAPARPGCLLRMALRHVADASRFGTVLLQDGLVCEFRPRGSEEGGLMNAGIYLVDRNLLDRITTLPYSLEADLFPALAAEGRLEGIAQDAFLLDIGVPADYAAAAGLLARYRRRPAVFFDRDGTLNHDEGYTHRLEDLCWLPGAREAIRAVNQAGWFAFVVTNQAGIAHGHYTVEQMHAFHTRMDEELAVIGAHIDEYRFCPFHPDGVVSGYVRASECRKPEPGMITGLAQDWPVDLRRSLLVGDRESDMEAARRAGISGVLAAANTLISLEAYLHVSDKERFGANVPFIGRA